MSHTEEFIKVRVFGGAQVRNRTLKRRTHNLNLSLRNNKPWVESGFWIDSVNDRSARIGFHLDGRVYFGTGVSSRGQGSEQGDIAYYEIEGDFSCEVEIAKDGKRNELVVDSEELVLSKSTRHTNPEKKQYDTDPFRSDAAAQMNKLAAHIGEMITVLGNQALAGYQWPGD